MQNIHSIILSCLMLYNRQKKILTKFLNFLYKTPLRSNKTTKAQKSMPALLITNLTNIVLSLTKQRY